jgi:hypothetical protein
VKRQVIAGNVQRRNAGEDVPAGHSFSWGGVVPRS